MFFYIGMLLWFIAGNMFSNSISDTKDTPAVSVIIAIRNGEDALSHLLTNLSSQDYTGEMEFILVDDESEDSSKIIISVAYISIDYNELFSTLLNVFKEK